MPANQLAVLDLGSNSFHMLVASLDEHHNIQILDKLKDSSRLAGGLDTNKNLTIEAQERALEYFKQYAERLKDFKHGCVRCVATDTFRKAKNGQSFLKIAEQTLGWPIEIISGIEEARLIYKGVSQYYPSDQSQLVVDIGGGSTELIIGKGALPINLASTKMGCVSWTQRYFNSSLNPEMIEQAISRARQTLSPYSRKYRKVGWKEAYGSSGTIKAIGSIMIETNRSDGTIFKAHLRQLKDELSTYQSPSEFPWQCITESRQQVLAGGVTILFAVMESLRIEQIKPTNSALREGVLIEMVGRIFGEDIREKTINSMVKRFSIDTLQSSLIEQTALRLFESAQTSWGLIKEDQTLLRWACMLHEIGLSIAFRGHNRHGEYIIQNAEMDGFSRPQQSKLALIIHAQRGSIKVLGLEKILNLTENNIRLIFLVRLSTRLHRRRSPKPQCIPDLIVNNNKVEIIFPPDYLKNKSLTAADLHIEVAELAKLGILLEIR